MRGHINKFIMRRCSNDNSELVLRSKDYEAKMFQAILMTTFSSSLFVRQWVQASAARWPPSRPLSSNVAVFKS
jgi:hypothetical protein